MADVAAGIHDKLVRRHPHVFTPGDHATDDASLVQTWDSIKKAEKEAAGRPAGPFDSIPTSLPALAYATAVVKKATRAGHPVTPDADPAGEAERIGAALLALVIEARAAGIDAETALRDVVRRHRESTEAALGHQH
jgi:XTP/dITP diphosphohydrolase